ncbi:MAG: histidinol dehydrogenase [Gammaproteobacteria bacterium]|jgi:histidinol dehydrogenase
MKKLSTKDLNFQAELASIREWQADSDIEVLPIVRGILDAVRRDGDAAVLAYTQKFDRHPATCMADLEFDRDKLEQALERISPKAREALEFAVTRLTEYAAYQKIQSFEYVDSDGNTLGQRVTPIDRAGLYAPGGLAAYPSSVLMNVIPAKVAGVDECVMVSPMPGGKVSDMTLAAAAVAGVDRVFTIGGAQAIAAMAYGTESIPAVDKITGPGNIWVATAKRLVFGTVGIDMFAGPSEVLVIADETANPDWVAMDMFAQAEHDAQAQAVLLSTNTEFTQKVLASIERLLPSMARADIIRQSLMGRGVVIDVADIDEAVAISNDLAPEHLEIAMDSAEDVVGRITHAGAIFVGHYSAEAMGDYCAGPNHVLPTARNARFASSLGVYDFQKRSSIIHCNQQGAKAIAQRAETLGYLEGLNAHALSAAYRK